VRTQARERELETQKRLAEIEKSSKAQVGPWWCGVGRGGVMWCLWVGEVCEHKPESES
jgi:hypothetical protein